MKVLIIEDEADLRRSLKEFLYQEGYVVESANDFKSGSAKANDYDYDCIVVDITLPHGSGLDIIRQLKKRNTESGIIIISAKNSIDDKVTGLADGADDYLTKPFHLSELNARIKAIIRRKKFSGSTIITANEINIEPEKRKVSVAGNEIVLTSKEYDLLLYFISNKNRVLSKNAIAEHLWGDHADHAQGHDFIYTHIKNLRKKMLDGGGKDYLQTVYGIGYNFKIETA